MTKHSIDNVLADVSRRWRDQNITLLPPASKDEFTAFETRFHVNCPDDFERYLMLMGGMASNACDEEFLRFWPLAEVRPDPEAMAYFVFADFSLSAHEYGIRLSTPDDSVVAILGVREPIVIASTFTDFMTLYLNNVGALFLQK